MASDRTKWNIYVHSCTSGTQSVNTTPFCAGTQALVSKHQMWTAPFKTASHRAMGSTLVEAHTVTFPRFFFPVTCILGHIITIHSLSCSLFSCCQVRHWSANHIFQQLISRNFLCLRKKRDLTNIKVARKEQMINKSIRSLESLSNCPLQYHR